MHGVTGVAGDLVETLSSAHRLLDGVLVALDLIVWRQRGERTVQTRIHWVGTVTVRQQLLLRGDTVGKI